MFRMVNRCLPFSIPLLTIMPMVTALIDDLSTEVTAAREREPELLRSDRPDLQVQ
jgi:hypothetical protein